MQPRDNGFPWETVSIELVGPLSRSSEVNTYLAVSQDGLAKWVQRRPIRKPSVSIITKALYEEIVIWFWCTRTVITDNGTRYTRREFRNFLEEM